MLTKSTPVVMATTALIIVCSPVSRLREGGWERDEGGGVVRLEPRNPPGSAPCLPVLASRGPCASPPCCPGPPRSGPAVPVPGSSLPAFPEINGTTCAVSLIPGSAGTAAGQALFSLPLHKGGGGPWSPSER